MTTVNDAEWRPRRIGALLGDGVVVTEDGEQVLLNETAEAVWELCDGRTSPAEMLHAMRQLFNVSEDQLSRDLHEALTRLAGARLIVR